MNSVQTTQLLTLIELSWPRERPDGWELAWEDPLRELPYEPALTALERLRRSAVHPPSVSELRLATAEGLGLIPPDPQGILALGWASRARDALYRQSADLPPSPHAVIDEAVRDFGGVEAVCEDPTGWRRFWVEARALAIKDVLESDAIERVAALAQLPAATSA